MLTRDVGILSDLQFKNTFDIYVIFNFRFCQTQSHTTALEVAASKRHTSTDRRINSSANVSKTDREMYWHRKLVGPHINLISRMLISISHYVWSLELLKTLSLEGGLES